MSEKLIIPAIGDPMPEWLMDAIAGNKFEPVLNETNRWGEAMRVRVSGRIVRPGDVITADEIV